MTDFADSDTIDTRASKLNKEEEFTTSCTAIRGLALELMEWADGRRRMPQAQAEERIGRLVALSIRAGEDFPAVRPREVPHRGSVPVAELIV
jgi:hypothetical protein